MSHLPASHVVRRSFGLFLVVALVTAGTPMNATALRGQPAPTEVGQRASGVAERPVREPRAVAAVAPGRVAETPRDPRLDRQEAASARFVARDAAAAALARAAQARAEAEARAKAEAAAKAKAAAEAKAKAKAAAAAKAKAIAAAKAKAAAAAKAKAAAAAKAKAQAAAQVKVQKAAPKPAATGYRGRNHFWYPALGINASVSWFPCSRSEEPGSPVYRWGCAGANNVYLMAHAWSHFRALNRAYYNGGLRTGQLAVYADNNGRVHYYRLAWYKTGPPTTGMSWAWAAQSRSSMTLQTCIGANSELRLFVRFHEVAAP